MTAHAHDRRLRIWVFALAAAVLVLSEAAWQTGALSTLETGWSDLWFRLAGERRQTDRVVLVEIDEATLAAHADDPLVFWTPHFARAIGVLRGAGVKTIGIDLLFSISPERWLGKIGGSGNLAARSFDRDFRQQLASGVVVLAASHQSGPDPLLPTPDYLAALPDFDIRRFVGATNLELDSDGTWRRLAALAPGARTAGPESPKLLAFPLLLALHASGQRPGDTAWTFGKRQLQADEPAWPVAFTGPPGTTPRLSMRELLAPEAASNPRVQSLAGRVVIIGPAFGGSNDNHLTPYGHGLFDARLMSGPEIHAQAVDALLSGDFIEPASRFWRLLFMALLLAAGLALWLRLPAGRGALALFGLLAVATLASALAHFRLVLLPLAPAQLGLVALFAITYGLRLSFGERERERVRSMFSRYVSGEIVDALIESGEMPALGGRALEITVLFSDIRNFTTLSERLPPEAVVALLNRWFERACAILRAEGGCIDKFIGDAIMAEFGSPLPCSDHARRALRAALKLQAAADEMQTWLTAEHGSVVLPTFAVGVGVHTGRAVVGNIGSLARLEFTAIGDTVNLASRLEGVTKTLGCTIVASRATLDSAGSGVATSRTHTLKVKGRKEPVEVYAIEALEETSCAKC